MDNIKRAITKVTCWCIVFTALLPVGLFMTIFGAVKGQFAVMGVGIGFLVVGFYGTPLIWVKFADAHSYKRVVSAVSKEKIYSISQIATHLNLKEKVVLEKVDVCIRREFLLGYIREGDTIRPNQNINATTTGYKCEACGARFECPIHTQPKCPYCGTVIK